MARPVLSESRGEEPLVATARILVVDDDREIRDLVSHFLEKHGYAVESVRDGREMNVALARNDVDLVILDIMLPGKDGLELCREIRERSHVPILMLTAMGEETDRIVGLEMGADDYLAKPFSPRELLARVRALLRRVNFLKIPPGARATGRVLHFAGWALDLARRRLTAPDGMLVGLTSGEFEMLVVFAEHPHQVLSRDQLLDLTRGRELLALRPQRRRPGEPAQAEDRARPEGAVADRDGEERRLRLHAERRFAMKRFIPDSLAAWALVTLIVGLVVTQVSTLVVIANGRETRQQMMEFFRLAERVSSVTRAVATASEDLRPTLAAALSDSTLGVHVDDAMLATDTIPDSEDLAELQDILEARLADVGISDVHVERWEEVPRTPPPPSRPAGDRGRSKRGLPACNSSSATPAPMSPRSPSRTATG